MEADVIMASARRAKELGIDGVGHLDTLAAARNYIRIADTVAADARPGRLLDWGCGLGQMTYLLRRRDICVVPFEIGAPDRKLPDIPMCEGIEVVWCSELLTLPFDDCSFDSVLSCGVLEHVDEICGAGAEKRSLEELRRILKPGGKLFVYQLPQQYAWQEALVRTFRLGYAHSRRYLESEIRSVLHASGFEVARLSRANLLAKNLPGVPNPLRDWYGVLAAKMMPLDLIASQWPLLRYIAGVFEIHAFRR